MRCRFILIAACVSFSEYAQHLPDVGRSCLAQKFLEACHRIQKQNQDRQSTEYREHAQCKDEIWQMLVTEKVDRSIIRHDLVWQFTSFIVDPRWCEKVVGHLYDFSVDKQNEGGKGVNNGTHRLPVYPQS